MKLKDQPYTEQLDFTKDILKTTNTTPTTLVEDLIRITKLDRKLALKLVSDAWNTKGKIKAVKWEIVKSEGMKEANVQYQSWEELNNQLALIVKGATYGYDKTIIEITWADGYKFSTRLDIEKDGTDSNAGYALLLADYDYIDRVTERLASDWYEDTSYWTVEENETNKIKLNNELQDKKDWLATYEVIL